MNFICYSKVKQGLLDVQYLNNVLYHMLCFKENYSTLSEAGLLRPEGFKRN